LLLGKKKYNIFIVFPSPNRKSPNLRVFPLSLWERGRGKHPEAKRMGVRADSHCTMQAFPV
jgi:hypothetical protein